MATHFEVRHLLDGRPLLEGGVYFNWGTQNGGPYYRAVHIWSPALLEEMRYSGIVAGISYISFVLKDSKNN